MCLYIYTSLHANDYLWLRFFLSSFIFSAGDGWHGRIDSSEWRKATACSWAVEFILTFSTSLLSLSFLKPQETRMTVFYPLQSPWLITCGVILIWVIYPYIKFSNLPWALEDGKCIIFLLIYIRLTFFFFLIFF